MRPRNDVWQGDCGYWQDRFIRENLLLLGHAAWQGFMTQGRGMMVCDVSISNAMSFDWSSKLVEYTTRFLLEADVPAYLDTLNLETTLIDRLMDTIQIYDPAQAIVLLISANGRADINLLQQLAISPADCYQQVQQRWAEFHLDPSTQEKL